jgi:hypothetical protein
MVKVDQVETMLMKLLVLVVVVAATLMKVLRVEMVEEI